MSLRKKVLTLQLSKSILPSTISPYFSWRSKGKLAKSLTKRGSIFPTANNDKVMFLFSINSSRTFPLKWCSAIAIMNSENTRKKFVFCNFLVIHQFNHLNSWQVKQGKYIWHTILESCYLSCKTNDPLNFKQRFQFAIQQLMIGILKSTTLLRNSTLRITLAMENDQYIKIHFIF